MPLMSEIIKAQLCRCINISRPITIQGNNYKYTFYVILDNEYNYRATFDDGNYVTGSDVDSLNYAIKEYIKNDKESISHIKKTNL